MPPRRILLIQGHPDPTERHYGHALADAYADGATGAGHEVRRVEVAQLDFPLLRSQHEWHHAPLPASLLQSQQDTHWAEHLVFFFPLWMGAMPALLKGYIEQIARPGFAFHAAEPGSAGRKALSGRSARVVVTMGMPALVYRYVYGAHSLKALERNILGFVGIAPVRESLVGLVESADPAPRQRWLQRMRRLGERAE